MKDVYFFMTCLLAIGLLTTTPATPSQRCFDLTGAAVGGLTVTGATVNASGTFTVPKDQGGLGEDHAGTVYSGLPAYCAIEAARAQMHITVWLPLSTWNGRFQGVGGGGFVGGFSYRELNAALRNGYAGATTDSGHPASQSQGRFALNPDGSRCTWPATRWRSASSARSRRQSSPGATRSTGSATGSSATWRRAGSTRAR